MSGFSRTSGNPTQTRWLSVHFVVRRILEQFGALQLFFTDAVSKKDLLAAENILHKLNDPTTKLFLQFLDFVLPFFNSLNREMQAERPKLHLLYRNICNILKAIFDCFIKHPLEVKSGSIPSISDVAILFPNLIDESMLQPLDNEWRLLRNNNEILAFPDDVFLIWNEVNKIESGDGTSMFRTLVNFVFNILILPHSSANVERVFSQINLMKTNQRNKLDADTISALLHTKSYIGENNCHDFIVEKKIIQSMTSHNLYKNT
nr:uncharacterized protein LOC111418993 [Onthophagus taurus]